MARTNDKRTRGDGELGARIRRRRKVLGLTAKELARLAGVSPSYVSQLEHGTQDRPSLDVLSTLASALGVPPAELLGELPPLVIAPETPPTLAALAAELDLDAATTAMLADINVEGRQPATREGWLLVLLAIRHSCAGIVGASLPRAASG
jgi:transcriptional regulator with XRE-family HTH domain